MQGRFIILKHNNTDADLLSKYTIIFQVRKTSTHLFVSIHLFHVLIASPTTQLPDCIVCFIYFQQRRSHHAHVLSCYLSTIFVLVAWPMHFSSINILNINWILYSSITCIHSLQTKLCGNTTLNRTNKKVSFSSSPPLLTQLIQLGHSNTKSRYHLPISSIRFEHTFIFYLLKWGLLALWLVHIDHFIMNLTLLKRTPFNTNRHPSLTFAVLIYSLVRQITWRMQYMEIKFP